MEPGDHGVEPEADVCSPSRLKRDGGFRRPILWISLSALSQFERIESEARSAAPAPSRVSWVSERVFRAPVRSRELSPTGCYRSLTAATKGEYGVSPLNWPDWFCKDQSESQEGNAVGYYPGNRGCVMLRRIGR